MTESTPSLHCFICNNRAGVSIRNAVPIFNEQISISNNPLPDTICSILDCSLLEKEVHSSIICKKCYKLCEEYNEAQLRLSEIRNTLKDQFQKTLLIHNLDINTVYKKSDSTDLSVDLDSSNAKQKEQLVAKSNGLTDESKKLNLPLPGAKISPLPPNVLIVHKGKKLALQKTSAIAQVSPEALVNIKKTLPISDSSKQKLKALKLNPLKPQKPFIKVDGKPKTEGRFLEKPCILDNLVQELPDADTKEISAEINSCEEEMAETDIANADLECLDGSEELHSALSRVKMKKKKMGGKYIISEVEIMEDAEENLEVEEGTILMGQDENGEIIRVLRSAGGRLVRDRDGNVLYRGNSEISLVLPDQDGDIDTSKEEEDDEIEYTTESLKMECQDSNDGSHIELQMSGDEETAKAIIAAAGNRNTYIKLESESGFPGMFRVRALGGASGESEEEEEEVDTTVVPAGVHDGVDSIVERNGSLYTCVLCLNAEKQSGAQEESLPNDNTFTSDNGSSPEELLQNGSKGSQTGEQTELNSTILGDAKSIMQHIRAVHNARVYICPLCGDVVRKRLDLTRHIEEYHASDETQEDCKLGKKQSRHITSARPHACHICFRKYSSRNLLEEHMNVHNGIRPYSCEVCGKSFASKYTHQAHMKTHTIRPRPHSCQQCPKAFFTLQNLAQHEKTHSGIKNFFCKVCGKAFGTQHNLEVHGVVHSGFKPFVCRTCGKAFARRAEIRDHERTHTGERPFSCDICGATFSQRSNLQSHKRATHLDDKRHGCPHCDKRFKRRRLLEYHIKASHTGERPYKCDICNATFVYPEHFKKHRRIHSGEKPYVCEVCGKSFNSRDNRNAHRFVHSDKKPYECLVCGTGFMRKPLLYAHMNTQGHLTDTIVVNQPRLAVENSASDGPVVPHILNDGSTIEERIEEIDSNMKDKNVITGTNVGEHEVPVVAKMLIAGEHRIIIHDDQQIYTTQVVGDNSQQRQLIFATEGEHMSKSTLSLVPGSGEEGGILTLSGNIITKSETTKLMSEVGDEETLVKGEPGELSTDHIEIVTNEEGHVLTTDEDGSMIRLVQIQLPDGENGWVALDS